MKRRSFITRTLSIAIVGAGIASLAGCGFHLRGMGPETRDVGIDSLALTSTPAALTDTVGDALQNAGITLSDAAPLRLNLGDERIQQIELTGGDTGSRDIELQLNAPFSVQRVSDGAYLLDRQQLQATTTYRANDGDLLVRDDLRDAALETLRRDAARRLLDRLRKVDTTQ